MYWIPLAGVSGRLACSARPRSTQEVEGFQLVINLLEDHEIQELQLGWLQALRLPIPDRGCPPDRQALRQLLDRAQQSLQRGEHVLVHCRAGIGRSGLICACLLARLGVPPQGIWKLLSGLRGVDVPDTDEQKAWFASFVHDLKAPASLDEALRQLEGPT